MPNRSRRRPASDTESPAAPLSFPSHAGIARDALANAAHAFMVARFAPPHVLVDGSLCIRQASAGGTLPPGLAPGDTLQGSETAPDGALRATLRLIAEAAMRGGKAVVLDDIALGKGDGSQRLTLRAEPLSTDAGDGCLILFRDARDHAGAVNTGEIDVFLKFLLEDAGVAVVILDATLKVRGFTPRVHELAGMGDVTLGATAAGALGDLHDATIERDLVRVLQSGRLIERTLGSPTFGARHIKLLPASALITGQPGEGVAIIFQRVLGRRIGDGQDQAYAEDLNHRLKNILGNAIAMASLMLEGRPSIEDFHAAYVGRIRALADANNLVARSNWAGTELRAVVLQELESVAQRTRARIRIEGPVLVLRPRCAVTLGMALHEMAVNAAEHGAFAHAGMSLDVSWRLVLQAGQVVLVLDWVEAGGGASRSPTRRALAAS